MSRRVLIVHHPADEAPAGRLEARIQQAGFSTWRNGRDVQVGDSEFGRIDAVLACADPIVLLLSERSVGRGLTRRVARGVRERRSTGSEQRLLLAVLDACDVDSVRDQIDVPVVADCTEARFESGCDAIVRALGDPTDRWEQELRSYLERLFEHCRAVQPVGIATAKGAAVLPLDELYIPLHATPHRHRIDEMDAPFGSRRQLEAHPGATPLPGDDTLPGGLSDGGRIDVPLHEAFLLADRYRLKGLVVLGEPGSGKSTLLKHLALSCARDHGSELGGAAALGLPPEIVPVLIPLRRLDHPEAGLEVAIEAAVQAPQLGCPPAFGRWLLERRRPLLLLVDGLDEVADTKTREAVSRWLEAALIRLPDSRFVVTSRYAGYQGDARLNGRFLELHIRDLEEDEAGQFIDTWYRVVEGLEARTEVAARLAVERAGALKTRLFPPDGERLGHLENLRSLARNPLMLQLICLLHRSRVQLPDRRVDLYEQCVQLLLEVWPLKRRDDVPSAARAGKEGMVLTTREALPLLQPIAWWMMEKGEKEATLEELVPLVRDPLRTLARVPPEPAAVLEAIRGQSGVLVSLGQQRYGFLHLSFQEYLAARHVQEELDRGERVRVLARHYGEKSWREVILLSVGLVNPSPFQALMRAVIDAGRLGVEPGLLDDCLRDAVQSTPAPFLEALAAGGTDAETRFHCLRALKGLEGWRVHELLEAREEPSKGWLSRLLRRPARQVEIRRTGQAIVEAIARSEQEEPAVRRMALELLEREGVPVRSGDGEPHPGEEIVDERTGIVLVYVPGGEYVIGSEEYPDEQPIHRVHLAPFWIGKYPVTNQEYLRFLSTDRTAGRPEHLDDRRFGGPRQPVVGVSWDDAQRFCRWAGLRLASEAEWEAAARGPEGRRYPWGDEEPTAERANFGAKLGQTTPVDAHPAGAGPFGTLDQAGNVWEWVEDVWHASYAGAPPDGSAWTKDGQIPDGFKARVKTPEEIRVFRGGSWLDGPVSLRASYRCWLGSGSRSISLGFRVVRPVAASRP